MLNATRWKEASAALTVVLVLVGVPLLLWHWRSVELPHRYPAGSKIITLTAIADGGVWTQEDVIGLNYWWKKATRTDEIPLKQGDHVVVRLHSADVLHSFAIPILRLGPVDVQAGHTIEMTFDANRAGVLTFLCWQVCSPEHPSLRGRFLVEASNTDKTW